MLHGGGLPRLIPGGRSYSLLWPLFFSGSQTEYPVHDEEKRQLVLPHRDYLYLRLEDGTVALIQEQSSIEESVIKVDMEDVPALIQALQSLL
jgi:hypothetical protein